MLLVDRFNLVTHESIRTLNHEQRREGRKGEQKQPPLCREATIATRLTYLLMTMCDRQYFYPRTHTSICRYEHADFPRPKQRKKEIVQTKGKKKEKKNPSDSPPPP